MAWDGAAYRLKLGWADEVLMGTLDYAGILSVAYVVVEETDQTFEVEFGSSGAFVYGVDVVSVTWTGYEFPWEYDAVSALEVWVMGFAWGFFIDIALGLWAWAVRISHGMYGKVRF